MLRTIRLLEGHRRKKCHIHDQNIGKGNIKAERWELVFYILCKSIWPNRYEDLFELFGKRDLFGRIIE